MHGKKSHHGCEVGDSHKKTNDSFFSVMPASNGMTGIIVASVGLLETNESMMFVVLQLHLIEAQLWILAHHDGNDIRMLVHKEGVVACCFDDARLSLSRLINQCMILLLQMDNISGLRTQFRDWVKFLDWAVLVEQFSRMSLMDVTSKNIFLHLGMPVIHCGAALFFTHLRLLFGGWVGVNESNACGN